ncbi:hypothetical protein SUGI_0255370 [Cryptomeria japonica]|uniref:calcium/calmodulin-regulated receptor-like kinase 1 isoform X1 n=2 Tax=Cryptomeria japonica TaxID=3369 RepID=UPI002408A2AF|nr:calcium/calmodulin-regulated receptor-like kinase 1 isoform X1 [Cryptomeria japonica]XP_057849702.2 calcium/calmodulin-regulated receptor-like kinase 1 isoform X1 [Cryptomeria japonica]GLJ15548.1 hypothetical protein SUGI_0255370 [Cryptomeria japonica]
MRETTVDRLLYCKEAVASSTTRSASAVAQNDFVLPFLVEDDKWIMGSTIPNKRLQFWELFHSTGKMGIKNQDMIIGISIGVTIGAVLATFTLLCIRFHRRRAKVEGSNSDQRGLSMPMRYNGADSSTVLSDSTVGCESPEAGKRSVFSTWWRRQENNLLTTASGIPRYPFRDLQKATHNFTTVLGQGAFGPVYKATMATGETVAIKVLATDSKQGEKEFQTEVLLLGRLHHRNLVNLVGYCVDKGHRMLVYEFMSNGSLARHLYDESVEPLNWERRVRIAHDVSRGIEYLHDGAVPSVVHRDIKSANILLDNSMRARVADFGLSREENGHVSDIKGTYGYLDPEYVSTKTFTKKSDVYSFGVLLFELISGRNPQQGLMEYVELAALSADERSGWEEILDSRLNGKYNLDEVTAMANLAYKCIQTTARRRPVMRDVAQVISRTGKKKRINRHEKRPSSITGDENSEAEQIEPPKFDLKSIIVTNGEILEAEEQKNPPNFELNVMPSNTERSEN